MPTERFMRLPKEKIEAIRAAAAKEFMRVAPEEVSINGSFTTRIYREEAFTHILKINRIC